MLCLMGGVPVRKGLWCTHSIDPLTFSHYISKDIDVQPTTLSISFFWFSRRWCKLSSVLVKSRYIVQSRGKGPEAEIEELSLGPRSIT